MLKGPRRHALAKLGIESLISADVVFIALHGGQGEDGTVQAFLDVLGVPYTGSGMLASALAMEKPMAKAIFRQELIRTPDWLMLNPDSEPVGTELACRVERILGFPAVVKPSNQGSTVGVTIVREQERLAAAVTDARAYSGQVLVERYISGREITVGILGEQPLPVIEVRPEHGIYDYECKYTKGKSNYIVPAELPGGLTDLFQQTAMQAFDALGCEGYARVDFRLGEDDLPYCLEVNTIPGMTGTSLVPMAAKAAGLDFPDLVDEIVGLALRRHAQRRDRPIAVGEGSDIAG